MDVSRSYKERKIDPKDQVLEEKFDKIVGKMKDYKYDWIHGYINLPSIWNKLS